MSAATTPQGDEKPLLFTIVLRLPEYLATDGARYSIHQVKAPDASAAFNSAQEQACDMQDGEQADDFEHVLTIPGWVEPSHMGPERDALRWQNF